MATNKRKWKAFKRFQKKKFFGWSRVLTTHSPYKEGMILLRRGVKDISIDPYNYRRVIINVDRYRYLRGLAVYGKDKDFPDGIDIVVYCDLSRNSYNHIKVKKPWEKYNKPFILLPNVLDDYPDPFNEELKRNALLQKLK